jgi:hypothetical protein
MKTALAEGFDAGFDQLPAPQLLACFRRDPAKASAPAAAIRAGFAFI